MSIVGSDQTTLLSAQPNANGLVLPALVIRAGDEAGNRFVEFFTAQIRNPNTRRAYGRAIARFFGWCESQSIELHQIKPVNVAVYIEQHPAAKPTVKQHLAAIRMLFDWLVTGQIVVSNPARSVRGPKHVVRRGKTPVLSKKEARHLLNSIDTSTIIGLRDRALIAVMAFSFARISAALGMKIEDCYSEAGRRWFRLHEKGGKRHEVPAHPKAVCYLEAYIAAAEIADDPTGPLFRSIGRNRRLSARTMTSNDALKMIKRRAKNAGLSGAIGNHTFRATGITTYLENGGFIEHAQAIANHEDPRTTMLYDRRADRSMFKEVKRVAI